MPSSVAPGYHNRLCLLGQPVAHVGRSVVTLPEKGFALIAALTFADGYQLSRENVRDLLWCDVPAPRRSANLRQLLLRLSRINGPAPVIALEDGALRLDTVHWHIDLLDLLQADRANAELLSPAQRGPLLEGIAVDGEAFEEWLIGARRSVGEKRTAIILSALAKPDLSAAARAGLAQELVQCDPFEELGYRLLMVIHAEAGNLQMARRCWLSCRNRLNDELGIQPSAETQELAMKLGLEGTAASPVNANTSDQSDPLGTPTVVVMPPAVLPGNELLDRLGLAVLEEITLGLSQFGSFRVIAAHTSWQLSRHNQKAQKSLDARFDYAVTVGVRSADEPLKVTCRLTRLSSGEVLWATELEIHAANLQISLNTVVRKTVASLAAIVERSESRLSLAETNATGYRLYLEGKRSVGATGLEPLRAARKWFKLAVKRCDEFSSAFAGLSRTLSMEWLVRGMTDRELLTDAMGAAHRAHECDPGNGRAVREIGFTSLYMRRYEDSLAHFSEARSLAPNDADLLADYADALMHNGHLDKALDTMRLARNLNPLSPDYYRWIEASILYRLGKYEEGIETLQPIAKSPATARLMAASHAMAGDMPGARRYAATVRENYPTFRSEQLWDILPDRHRADTAQLIAGLQLAGLD